MGIGWIANVKGSLAGMGSGTTGNSMFATIGSTGVVLTYAVIFFLLLGLVILVMRHMMMYTRDVYVFKIFSSGIKLFKLQGRHFKDKSGKFKFHAVRNFLQFKPLDLPLMDQEYLINKEKGEAIFLLQVAPGDYKPIGLAEAVRQTAEEMEDQGFALTILNQNAANHTLQIHREIVEKHKNQSKLLLYMPTIMMVGGMIFVVVLLWMTLGRIESMNSAITSAATQVAEALRDAGKTVIS